MRKNIFVLIVCIAILFCTMEVDAAVDSSRIDFWLGIKNTDITPANISDLSTVTLVEKINYLSDKLSKIYNLTVNGKKLLSESVGIDVSQGIPTFDTIASKLDTLPDYGYDCGYEDGKDAGYESGYTQGYTCGQNFSTIDVGDTNSVFSIDGEPFVVLWNNGLTAALFYLGRITCVETVYSEDWGDYERTTTYPHYYAAQIYASSNEVLPYIALDSRYKILSAGWPNRLDLNRLSSAVLTQYRPACFVQGYVPGDEYGHGAQYCSCYVRDGYLQYSYDDYRDKSSQCQPMYIISCK